jgi:uncharacterized iron-regulated membrane protein
MSTLSDVGIDESVDPVQPRPADRIGRRRPERSSGLFRAFWRWHFYASMLVVPILLMLAVTGLIYLFRWQIDPAMHPGILTVQVPAHGAPVPYAAQENAVLGKYPSARIASVQESGGDRSTVFTVKLGEDDTRNVYVNPYTATVLGSLKEEDLLSNLAVQVHGSIVVGSVRDIPLFHDPIAGAPFTVGSIGDRIIELAACWAIVMAITGYYLFVRGRAARLKRLSHGAKAAALRHRHGVVGALLGGGLLMLVVSGLPWTGLWGERVQQWAGGHGLSLWGDDPGATSTLGAALEAVGSSSAPAPWAEGQGTVPTSSTPQASSGSSASAGSGAHAGHDMSGMVMGPDGMRIDVDQAISVARADGLPGPYYVMYPEGKDGVFSVLGDQWHDKANPAFSDVSKERTVHVDQYSGAVAGRYGYSDYSVAAKTVSQGIALHEGRRFGSFNLVATTAFCLGIIFLCISGPLMWWKRRPRSAGLAAPAGRMPIKAAPWLLVPLVLLGVLLPMFGITMLLVLLFDQLVVRRVGALRRALSSS